MSNQLFRLGFYHLSRGLDFQVAWLSAVSVVLFELPLFSCELDFLGVDHHAHVAVVYVWPEGRFVFSDEKLGEGLS